MKQLPKADIKGKYRQAIYLYIASTEQVWLWEKQSSLRVCGCKKCQEQSAGIAVV